MEMPTASIAVDAPISDPSQLPEAIYCYDRGARLCGDAIKEYERHLKTYTANMGNYQSHMADLRARDPLLRGDRDYLKAMMAHGAERQALLKQAAEEYRQSIHGNIYIVLRYYVSDVIGKATLPPGVTRDNLEKLPDDKYLSTYAASLELIHEQRYDPDADDRGEYENYINRALARLKQIPGIAGPTTVPVVPVNPTTMPAK